MTLLLYQLFGFYIEVVYNVYRIKIYKLTYSDSTDLLDPYLEQVEIELLA